MGKRLLYYISTKEVESFDSTSFYMIINIDNRIPSTLLRILIKMIISAFSIVGDFV